MLVLSAPDRPAHPVSNDSSTSVASQETYERPRFSTKCPHDRLPIQEAALLAWTTETDSHWPGGRSERTSLCPALEALHPRLVQTKPTLPIPLPTATDDPVGHRESPCPARHFPAPMAVSHLPPCALPDPVSTRSHLSGASAPCHLWPPALKGPGLAPPVARLHPHQREERPRAENGGKGRGAARATEPGSPDGTPAKTRHSPLTSPHSTPPPEANFLSAQPPNSQLPPHTQHAASQGA